MNNKSKHHIIKNVQQLNSLLASIKRSDRFADSFQFDTEELRETFLKATIPNNIDFEEKYFYFDEKENLHISESSDGYFWISTIGLLPTAKYSDNTFVNAFQAQKVTLSALLDSAENLLDGERIYDIDSYENEQLKIYTPAIWQNVVFFFELFGKAYLSISGKKVKQGHHISKILDDVASTMFELYHNDTLFHAYVIPEFQKLSEYIKNIPGQFNEAFIKYDANIEDSTCFPFSKGSINSLKNLVSFSEDFILDYYYSKDNHLYLRQGLHKRLLQKATDKNIIEKTWGFLNTRQEDTNHADA